MKGYFIKFFTAVCLIVAILLVSAISCIILERTNFSFPITIAVFIIGGIILSITWCSLSLVKTDEKKDKENEEKIAVFKKDVEDIKEKISKSGEITVHIRKNTEVEIVADSCKARLEDGKIKCIISFAPEELVFDSIEEFTNYFYLAEEDS